MKRFKTNLNFTMKHKKSLLIIFTLQIKWTIENLTREERNRKKYNWKAFSHAMLFLTMCLLLSLFIEKR
jgi:uncharacterized ion transporter superfamily protein YfcC